MSDCIFCKIVAGEIPSERLVDDDELIVFRDIQPQAPTHLLAIPKRHIEGISATTSADALLVGRLIDALRRVAAEQGLEEYRIATNCGATAGQSVFHLHFHLVGGQPLRSQVA